MFRMKISQILANIDKNVALNNQSLSVLENSFNEHKHSEYKRREKAIEWENMILEKVKTCPESEHIKIQNGKIDDMSVTLKAVKILVTTILVLGTIFGIILGTLQYVSGEETNKYQYRYKSDRVVMIDELLFRMNHSAGAMALSVIFECNNKNSDIPVLTMTLLNNCLQCDRCSRYIEENSDHFMQISAGWYKWFGTHRVDIRNKDGKTMYMIIEGEE